ncbi:NAD(P)H-hydrate epimerase [Calycomorphotria hydatis]|uniref:NAD(P)H-hydrate epimerase n=1 Tax=Calycomorphotria hydatis TaxID=2528027 RepID=A0A517T375_9PLAN|nr:NAD(P)H-hydrate epimerase [Calycomorphotria hydatis]QDT62832.1 Bifunctional NAD(P)H-hydrate repair enzyme Nnr [Calycomorphotria hydatis]
MKLTREQVRDVDRIAIEEYGLPGIVLMENAGRNTAHLLLEQEPLQTVTICCGKGNNGGDGYVIARHLLNHGYSVKVLLFADPSELMGDAAINFGVLKKMNADITTFPTADEVTDEKLKPLLSGSDWIVDALLGTGTRGELREPFPIIINAINKCDAKVLAVDLPSGLDCNTGEVLGTAVQANITATFVAEKAGFEAESARDVLGEVRVVDIGAPLEIVDRVTQENR